MTDETYAIQNDAAQDSAGPPQSPPVAAPGLRRPRECFAQAQECFAAGEFEAARKRLEEIPPEQRSADVRRLRDLVGERLREVADLRRQIVTELDRETSVRLAELLQRFLELQPGDEWGNHLRHRLEEQEHRQARASRPVERKRVFGNRSPERVDAQTQAGQPREVVEFVEDNGVPGTAGARPQDVVDEDLQEIWEFGERMAKKAPPPLPGDSGHYYAELIEEDDEEDRSIPAGVWVAVAVSGAVVLLAIIATIVVLVVESN